MQSETNLTLLTSQGFSNVLDRFWRKVDKNGPIPSHRPELGPCWLWTAGKDEAGYGKFGIGRRMKNKYAHRLSYEWNRVAIPSDKEIDHLCKNKSCVNPAHLEAVRHQTNLARATAKIGWDEVHAIRALKGKMIPAKIALQFGISRRLVIQIIANERWRVVQ